jgi:hypothetical protein
MTHKGTTLFFANGKGKINLKLVQGLKVLDSEI